MAGKGTLDKKKFNVDLIFEHFSSDVDNIHKELMDTLKKERSFIRLKRIGENQFYDATSNSGIEMESQVTRSCYAEMNSALEDIMQKADTLINNKFDDNFHNRLKDLVLNKVTMLYPPKQKPVEESESETVLPSSGNSDETQKPKRKHSSEVSPEKIVDLSDTENAKKILSKKNEESLESKFEDETITFDSLSSVHTSDLSSFDEELVFSSDEETGTKGKRMSMDDAKERLAEFKSQKLNLQKSKENQKNKDTSKLATPVKESSIPQKPLRIRKPNSRYLADEMVSPLTKTSAEKIPASAVNKSSQKRGRPRKKT